MAQKEGSAPPAEGNSASGARRGRGRQRLVFNIEGREAMLFVDGLAFKLAGPAEASP